MPSDDIDDTGVVMFLLCSVTRCRYCYVAGVVGALQQSQ